MQINFNYKLIFWLVALVLMSILGSRLIGSNTTTELWENPLKKVVDLNIKGVEGQFAVGIVGLNNTESYFYNQKDIFPAASLYKLVLMAAILNEVEAGTLKLEDQVGAQTSYLQDRLGSVDFGYIGVNGEVKYTIEECLIRMATISDNYAAILLTDRLGKDKMKKMALELGMLDTNFDPEITTTAYDMTEFYRRIYQGRVVSKASSDKIINLLSQSKLNNRIPDRLPPELKIAHKTGELARVRHDAGIIFLDGAPYILVMLSKELKFEDTGVDVQAKISQDVYQYFFARVAPTQSE